MNKIISEDVAAVVLAGGKSRRMQGLDKLQLRFGEYTLLEQTLITLQAQCNFVALNCNKVPVLATEFSSVQLIPDKLYGEAGPLDGLISTMEWLGANKPECGWLLSTTGDCPFLPEDLLAKLCNALERQPAQLAVASSAGRQHYACALWSLELAEAGRQFLQSGARALRHFISQCEHIEVEFKGRGLDPFYNVNTQEEYTHALELFTAHRPPIQ